MFNEGLLEEEFESKKDIFRELIEKLIQAIGYLDDHFINAENGTKAKILWSNSEKAGISIYLKVKGN